MLVNLFAELRLSDCLPSRAGPIIRAEGRSQQPILIVEVGFHCIPDCPSRRRLISQGVAKNRKAASGKDLRNG